MRLTIAHLRIVGARITVLHRQQTGEVESNSVLEGIATRAVHRERVYALFSWPCLYCRLAQ